MSTQGWSGREAADIVGITYRQLDYWARTDLIRPSLADARGSGSRRRYAYRDLIELRMVKTLLDAGQKLEHVRRAFGYLRERMGDDLSSARLVIAGESVVLVEDDESLIDVIASGQGVLNLLALDGVRRQVDAGITELRRAGGQGTPASQTPASRTPASQTPASASPLVPVAAR